MPTLGMAVFRMSQIIRFFILLTFFNGGGKIFFKKNINLQCVKNDEV